MIYEGKTITLKDGRACRLRAPRASDAEEMNRFIKTISGETPYILRTPEECTETLEQETRFLEGTLSSPDCMMIIAETDDGIAGNCQINFKSRVKEKHRASVGIGLYKKYWGLGIGTALLSELVEAARARGVTQVELQHIEGNFRARALYEKVGFRIVGELPNAIRLTDGTMLKLYQMVLPLAPAPQTDAEG